MPAGGCWRPWMVLLCLALMAGAWEEVRCTRTPRRTRKSQSERQMLRVRKMKEQQRARRVQEMMREPPLAQEHAPATPAPTALGARDWAQVLQAAREVAVGRMVQQPPRDQQTSVGIQQGVGSGVDEHATPSTHTFAVTKPPGTVKTTVEFSTSKAIWKDKAFLRSMIKDILLAIALVTVTAALVVTRCTVQRKESELFNQKQFTQV